MLCPYTQDELVDMSIQFWQKLLESLLTALCLWDMGVGNIVMLGSEMNRLAFLMTHPSLH